MRALLALFHFNVQYVTGNPNRYHRYCSEAIGPFLQAVLRNPHWRLSVAVAGSSLEFLNDHHPRIMRTFRALIEQGRIELISSTYTPSLWVAFPRKDLLKSIELNRVCLLRLGLPISRVFFAQEAFFGPAVGTLGDFFDLALCKDDYLSYFTSFEQDAPLYRVGAMPVIIGENHLLNELGRRYRRARWRGPALTERHRVRLRLARRAFFPRNSREPVHTYHDVAWRWYHMGSGHHFCACSSPENTNQFFADPMWLAANEYVWNSLYDEGLTPATVTEFFHAARQYPPVLLPALPEGSLNSQNSLGVLAWMGQQRNSWEDHSGLLSLVWRARAALSELDDRTSRAASQDDELRQRVEDIWKTQLFAECSDPLGWAPLHPATRFGFEAAEQVLRAVDSLCGAAAGPPSPDLFLPNFALSQRKASRKNPPFGPLPELFGARGSASFVESDRDCLVWEVCFTAASAACGVSFRILPEELMYCPSGMEHEPVRVSLQAVRPQLIALPLTNGLLWLGQDLYLIRDNFTGYVAARLEKAGRRITFRIDGAVKGHEYVWRFFLLRGSIEAAVELANTINCV